MLRQLTVVLAGLVVTACAHRPLSGGDLDQVYQPAFISRIEEGAGPKALVFRDDSSYSKKLTRLEPKEADRRLQVKLAKGMNRFELSETLRAKTLAGLPQEMPWTNLTDQASVARELQSFLVEEVPANPPDYNLLKPLGADAVVEFVIEDYGMRSKGGRAGVYIEGYGRMFRLDSGREMWRRAFRADQVDAGNPHVDPFRVAKEPPMFRAEMSTLLEGVAAQFAKDLTPPRRGSTEPPPKLRVEGEEGEGDQTSPRRETKEEELPEPDPL